MDGYIIMHSYSEGPIAEITWPRGRLRWPVAIGLGRSLVVAALPGGGAAACGGPLPGERGTVERSAELVARGGLLPAEDAAEGGAAATGTQRCKVIVPGQGRREGWGVFLVWETGPSRQFIIAFKFTVRLLPSQWAVKGCPGALVLPGLCYGGPSGFLPTNNVMRQTYNIV
jgi:hypothetical protein